MSPHETNALTVAGESESKAAERCERLKAGVESELGRLHKTNALLICTQYTANYGDVKVDISDAIAAIIERVERHIKTLDRLCTEASRHA